MPAPDVAKPPARAESTITTMISTAMASTATAGPSHRRGRSADNVSAIAAIEDGSTASERPPARRRCGPRRRRYRSRHSPSDRLTPKPSITNARGRLIPMDRFRGCCQGRPILNGIRQAAKATLGGARGRQRASCDRLLAAEKTPDPIHETAARFGRSGGRSGHVPVVFWPVTEGGAVDLAGPGGDPWRIGVNRLRPAFTVML